MKALTSPFSGYTYILKIRKKVGDILRKTTKNIIKGIGSSIDIMPAKPSRPTVSKVPAPPSSSAEAIAGDWSRVAQDIRISVTRVSNSNGKDE